MTPVEDARRTAIRELIRLAQEDRRRGIRYWFDPELATALRELVLSPASSAAAGTSGAGLPMPRAHEGGTPPGGAPPASAVPEGGAMARRSMRPAGTDGGGTGFAGMTGVAGMTGTAGKAGAAGPAGTTDTGGKAGAAAAKKIPQWGPPPRAEGRASDWKKKLEALEAEAAQCRACGLCNTRRNVVFGTGLARTPLVFVGEAPGADEDAQGIPFVGRAGQLLTKIIEAIGLSREDVYICNVLKCRPPENRNPAPDEIAHCSPFLARQLAILRPKVICTLGLFATQTLLQTTAPIGKLRGRLMEHDGLKIFPTYHPAALLRNPGLKATVWEDVQALRKILDS